MKTLLLLCAATLLSAAPPLPVWIDTDPSVQRGGHEVDDGFALVQAFHSPEIAIRGISAVFGNAPLKQSLPIGREILDRYGPPGMAIYAGAAKASDLGLETSASRALADALRQEPLTVLVLGPATNVATVVRNHPELRSRIKQLIAVAGRRPNQHFRAGTKNAPPFRDYNFELDAPAFQVLLDSGVPFTLAPWEVSSHVWLRRADLASLAAAKPKLQWLIDAAGDWLGTWEQNLGADGFNPFDTLAIAVVTSPALLTCERLPARIVNADDDVQPGRTKPFLIAGPAPPGTPTVSYCFLPAAAFKADLLARLTR